MAKGNMLLGKARGKVGSVVFSTLKGQQITRAHNSQVKNPRTTAQATQRGIFATTTVAASLLDDIVNHSFDNAENGEASRQEFIKTNIAKFRQMYDEQGDVNEYILFKGRKEVKPFPWLISQGRLGTMQPIARDNCFYVAVSNDSTAGDSRWKTINSIYPWFRNGCQVTFMSIIAVSEDGSTDIHYKVAKSRMVFNNLLESYQGQIFRANGDQSFGVVTAVLDMTKTENVSVVAGTGGETAEMVNPNVLTDYVRLNTVSATEERVSVCFADIESGYCVACAVIGTNYDENKTGTDKWVHTSSTFFVDRDRWDDGNDNVGSYMNAPAKITSSDDYLDQATTPYVEDVRPISEVVSAMVTTTALGSKGLSLTGSNTYGPVAEGQMVSFELELPFGYQFQQGTIKAYNGDQSLGNDWRIQVVGSRRYATISGPMPTTTSFQFNCSFGVFNGPSGTDLGVGALRCNISKANA